MLNGGSTTSRKPGDATTRARQKKAGRAGPGRGVRDDISGPPRLPRVVEGSMTSRGNVHRHRSARRRLPVVAVAVGMAFGFAMGALVELFLLGEGWRTTFEEGVYPLSFVIAMAGVFLGGILLVRAEHGGDRPSAWRAAAVFVASSVLAALLFWGAV